MKTFAYKIALMEGQQFLLVDKGWTWPQSAVNIWDEEGLMSRVGVSDNRMVAVAVAAPYIQSVPIKIVLRLQLPMVDDFSKWDHIVDVSIHSSSGQLTFIGQSGEENPEIILPSAGDYRVRISMANLKTADDENPNDLYQLDIWRYFPREDRKIIKW